jgi:thiol-disulfide isomerase/thioredoxin
MSTVSPPRPDDGSTAEATDGLADLDAPTTLPTFVAGTPRPSTITDRLGGIVAQPVRTFRALVDDDRSSFFEPLAVFAVVALALHAADTYRLLALFREAPLVVVRRLLDLVLRVGAADLGVLVGAAVVVAGLARLVGQRALGAATAVAYLIVPLALVKAIGGVLALAGPDLWWLPHRAVDSAAVVVGGRVSPARFVVKCIVAYGPGLFVLAQWLRAARAAKPAPSPRAVVARRGLAALLVVVVVSVGASAANVVGRADTLRPRLVGDAFPSLPLRPLPRAGRTTATTALPPSTKDKRRVDLVDVAAQPSTKVLVVDFWASWCGPCRRSLPELSAFAREHADRGVVVVGVNREPADLPAAQKAWADLAPAFETLVDDRGLGERLGLTSLPSSYVVDHTGRIRHLHLGLTAMSTLQAEVDALLREADAGAAALPP